MSKDLMGSQQPPVPVGDNLLLNNEKLVTVKESSRNLYLSGDWYLTKTVTSIIAHWDAKRLPKET